MMRLGWIAAAVFATTPVFADGVNDHFELKAGVLAHDLDFIATDAIEDGIDLNAELLLPSPDFLAPIFSPRPHIGVQINTAGDTSQVYAGATWTFELTDRVWLGLGGGGAVLNGETDQLGLSRKALGSSVLFRLSAELGFNITDQLNVSVYFDHESNAFLAEENPGLDNAGIRTGWRF